MSGALGGRRVLVTGASQGIGAACALALARAGATVVGAARGRARLDAAVAALPGAGHSAVTLDVADDAAWARAMAAVDAGGPLHGLVHAAGVLGPIGPIGEIDPADFSAALAINLGGTFLALHHTVPRLGPGGAAVTFSGGGGTGPLPRYDAYAASKAGVVRLSENVAAEAAAGGVRVNAIAPGFVATAIHDATLAAGPRAAGEAYYERTRRDLRAGGVPAELAAELACFLLGPEAEGITGRLLSAQWDPWRDAGFRGAPACGARSGDAAADRRRVLSPRGERRSRSGWESLAPVCLLAGGRGVRLGDRRPCRSRWSRWRASPSSFTAAASCARTGRPGWWSASGTSASRSPRPSATGRRST